MIGGLEDAEDAALYRLLQVFLSILRGDYEDAKMYTENALISIEYLVKNSKKGGR